MRKIRFPDLDITGMWVLAVGVFFHLIARFVRQILTFCISTTYLRGKSSHFSLAPLNSQTTLIFSIFQQLKTAQKLLKITKKLLKIHISQFKYRPSFNIQLLSCNSGHQISVLIQQVQQSFRVLIESRPFLNSQNNAQSTWGYEKRTRVGFSREQKKGYGQGQGQGKEQVRNRIGQGTGQ